MDDDLLPLLGIGVVQEDEDEEGVGSIICLILNANVILNLSWLYQSEFARIDCAYIILQSSPEVGYRITMRGIKCIFGIFEDDCIECKNSSGFV